MRCKSFAVAFILSFFKRRKQWGLCLVCSGLVYLIFFTAYIYWVVPSSYHSNYTVTQPHGFSPYGSDVNRTSTAPQVVHMVSISTVPLRSVALATIDSIARHMPNLTIKVHVTQEEDIPMTVLSQRVTVLNAQLEVFRSKGVKVNLILHDNIEADVAGTPLKGLRLQQRHVAGLYGVGTHSRLYAHASDLLRLLILFKHGGIYSDYDSIVIADMLPLFNYYGPNILTTNSHKMALYEDCIYVDMINGWFALEARHSLTAATLDNIATVINRDGADRVFPWNNKAFSFFRRPTAWSALGPPAITAAHRALCKGPPPVLLVNKVPSFLEPGNEKGVNVLEEYGNNKITAPYVIISRKYLMPLHWDYTERDWLADIDASAFKSMKKLRKLVKIVKLIDDSFQVHIFGVPKVKWLELLEEGNRYPLMQYMHAKSCQHLCDLKEFRRVLDLGKAISAS